MMSLSTLKVLLAEWDKAHGEFKNLTKYGV